MKFSALIQLSILLIYSGITMRSNCQETEPDNKSVFFIEPEYFVGTVYPNHSDFPETSHSNAVTLNLGWFHTSSGKKWASFYNFPFTGITISRSDLGNREVFGSQYSVLPYITFNTFNRLNHSIYFKIALGASYFTRHFHATDNPRNLVIGSDYTWSFQSFMYYSMFSGRYVSVNIGGGYLHSSNGHTQLPNIGMNQLALGITMKYFPRGIHPEFRPKDNRVPVDRKKSYYSMLRTGIGIHEYGSAIGPVGGAKRPVNSVTLSVGMVLREHIKIGIGFAGRYYHQYYYHILNPVDSLYSDKPILNASNLYFFLGCEFLTGHIGMNIEGGLNLYKPYFRMHYTTVEGSVDFDFWLKKLFNTKIGLNYYLVNTQKKPRTNCFIGASINANFGQADFSEVCIGITHLLSIRTQKSSN